MTATGPDAALHIVSADTDQDTCLNIAMLAAAALKFAAKRFQTFQWGCMEASTTADLTDWLMTIDKAALDDAAEMLCNGIVAAGEAT